VSKVEQVHGLNALRILAALMVVALHVQPNTMLGNGSEILAISRGGLGVDFFFILSGYVLAHVYADMPPGVSAWRSFIIARLARIYPLHLAIILGLVGLVVAAELMSVGTLNPINFPFDALPRIVTLTHAWLPHGREVWNAPSWSISAEWFAYLLFPVFVWVGLKARLKPRLVLGSVVGLYVIAFVAAPSLTGQVMTELTSDWGIYRIVPAFLLGVVLREVTRALVVPVHASRLAIPALLIAILAGLQLALADVLVGLLCAALIVAVTKAQLEPNRHILASRPMHYLGELSFALYMTHVPVHMTFFNVGQDLFGLWSGPFMPLWIVVLELVLMFAVAAFAYHVIEVPARAAIRARFERSRGSAVAKA
jgi:peptidoglycan/LPS O-acetylase OafA/YrhL